MVTINFNLADVVSLPVELKLDLIALCLRLLGMNESSVIIDGVAITDREEFQNWQIKNGFMSFKK